MTTTHTPGEIVVAYCGPSGFVITPRSEPTRAICECDVVRRFSYPELEANANRIITTWNAHDDLLEACKKSHATFRWLCDALAEKLIDINDLPGADGKASLGAVLLAAIAKAEGGGK